ncbi:eukaryotic translation initiation factor eIF1 [Eremomyces bilateralis CBS 781.70]|uniref:Eukaryotic translation initiation factor eIF1 n=1 Tax=Eremomyces bilateralis CBS 781.70 TaxID=1392243 RepID=A0A6G1G818_9PEZI|nr:eukaryotic translation initiation factor eIF1 [Eremomyces bilateralis CBS 781.70]KAF1814142.1 eukaryotic translation initiation factor eIF1 [Eremomyces bilateralis CBS 781.70]
MPRGKAPPRNKLESIGLETANPPETLEYNQTIARIAKNEGRNLFTVSLPNGKSALAELDQKFVNTVWMKRGGFVLVQRREDEDTGKVGADIINVVREDRIWKKMPWWPKQFAKTADVEDEESNVGKMPPSESEEEDSAGDV